MVSAAVVDHQTHQALSWAGRSRGNHVLELRGRGEGLVLHWCWSGTSRTEMVVMLGIASHSRNRVRDYVMVVWWSSLVIGELMVCGGSTSWCPWSRMSLWCMSVW